MSERGVLLATLERLFAGPRDSLLTLDEFLIGLEGRSYAFAIAALNFPNCLPTGIPWLSTVTGIPMLILLGQFFMGRPAPSLPRSLGCRGLHRGKLQAFLGRCGRYVRRLESAVHPRHDWWVSGLPRRLMQLAWAALILLLALPIPFDNFLPAWAILFFCIAQIEGDGIMAMLGWLFTVFTAIWTVFLLWAGHAAVMAVIAAAKAVLFN
jgi:hypothetical protein